MADYNLGTARGKVVIDSDKSSARKASTDVEGVGTAADKAKKKVGSLNDSLTTIGTSSVVAGAALAAGLGLAVNAAGDFEHGLSAIKAVSGATEGEMAAINAKAIQLGQDTAFGASQAVGAMEELVKAGLPIEDVLGTATDATVALAAAGEVDLSDAARITAASMNQFKLGAEDVTGVADLFAGAANASATGVLSVGNAMAYVGPVANAAGLSIEDTASAVSILANNGIDGQKAGTALRSILTKLQPTTEKASDAMTALGLVTEDGSNVFYDAQGNLKPMESIISSLNGAFDGLTDAQTTAYAKAIFGTESLSGVSALAGTTDEEFAALNKTILNTDAGDVAAERLNNMDGQLTILKGSVETAAILIGETLLPAITDIVKKVTTWVNKFGDLDAGTQETIVKVIAITAGALLLTGALIKVTMATIKLVTALWNVITAIGRGIAAVGKFIAKLALQTAAMLKSVAQGAILRTMYAKDMVVALAKSTAGFVANAVKIALSTAAMVAQKAILISTKVAIAVATAAQWAFNVAMSANPISLIIIAIVALIAGLVLFFTKTEAGKKIWESIVAFLGTAWNWLKTTAETVFGAIGAVVGALVDWFQTNVMPAIQAFGEFFGAVFGLIWDLVQLYFMAIWDIVKAVVGFFTDTVVPAIKAFVNKIIENFKMVRDKIVEIFTAIWDFIKGIWDKVYEFVSGIVEKAVGFITDRFNEVKATITTIFTNVYNFFKSIWDKVFGFIKGIVDKVKAKVTDTFTLMKDKVVTAVTDVYDGVKEQFDKVYDFIVGIKDKVVDFFTGAKDWLLNAGKDVIQGLLDGLNEMLGKITGFFTGLTDNIPDLKGPAIRDKKLLTENGQLIMQSLVDGFENSYGDVERSLKGLTDIIPSSVSTDINADLQGQAILAAANSDGKTFKYYAAPGSGQLDGEDELFSALQRARAVPGWSS